MSSERAEKWVETTVWRRYDVDCECGYMMQARWENGQEKGLAVCTKCGRFRELLDDGPPLVMRCADPARPPGETP